MMGAMFKMEGWRWLTWTLGAGESGVTVPGGLICRASLAPRTGTFTGGPIHWNDTANLGKLQGSVVVQLSTVRRANKREGKYRFRQR